jgi:putative sterol carrier protein
MSDTETTAETNGSPEGAEAPDLNALSGIEAEDLAKLVASATDEQLAEGLADEENRKRVLDEIFRRMTEHVNPEKAKGVDAVIHWQILDRPDGGVDEYEVVIKDGAATLSEEPNQDARITFKSKPVDFIRLVSGNAAGPMQFMSGKLKIEGDLMFAAQMTSIFRIPGAGASA